VSTAKRLHYTLDEYLRLLEGSPLKLEYHDGVIYAMAGATLAHAELATAAAALLRAALPPGCRVFSSDLKVRIEATDLSTFPDLSVACGPVEVSPRDPNALTTPSLLVEVTSRSTEDYDRGDKLSHYKQLPSLRAVLFVSHRERRITVVERGPGAWIEREHRGGEQVCLDAPALTFAVDALYDGIALDPS
jgi:Uma2 family endonuclease